MMTGQILGLYNYLCIAAVAILINEGQLGNSRCHPGTRTYRYQYFSAVHYCTSTSIFMDNRLDDSDLGGFWSRP